MSLLELSFDRVVSRIYNNRYENSLPKIKYKFSIPLSLLFKHGNLHNFSFFSLLFYSLKDFVNNASVAWVLSPLNLRSSAMTCTLLNPRDSISFTVSSVNGSWGKTVVSMGPSLLDVPLELLFSCASKIHSIHLKKSLYSSKSQIKL